MEQIGHFRAFYQRTLADGSKEFVASTSGVKRDGLSLDMRGGLLGNYLANPVVLWAHDYRGERLPIGRTVKLKPMAKELRATVTFDMADPFAAEVSRKYDEGFLNAVSIGWIDRKQSSDGKTVTEWELLDISAVPVPGDPDALLRREYAMLRSLVEPDGDDDQPEEAEEEEAEVEVRAVERRAAIPPHTTEKADEDTAWDGPGTVAQVAAEASALRLIHAWVDPEGDPDTKQSYKLPHHFADGRVVWRGVAAAMARLLQGGTVIPDGDRRGVWNHLERHYRQFEREAPELRSLAEFGPRLQEGAMPYGEWEHYRAELAEVVLAKAVELKQAITDLENATIPAPEPEPVEALTLLAEALKERT